MKTRFAIAALCVLTGCSGRPSARPGDIRPVVMTDPVSHDPDDPAIWVNPADPGRSLIIGTNKVPAPDGALVVFGLDGKTRQTIAGLDRPNNVDVEYNMDMPGGPIDIAVTTERLKRQLRIYRVTAEGLTEISSGGGVPVFEGQQGEEAAPMGIALYRRPRDGAVFALVGRKTGPRDGYLWQYRLQPDGAGGIKGVKVREFGRFSGTGEIEAIAVDDELGFVYYADEGDGIHKYHADPDHPDASREIAHFGRDGFQADREGIGIYARGDGAGYIVCTDQIDGNSRYFVYPREGTQDQPLKIVSGGADGTDGIEVTSASLGPQFPNGLLVAMNSSGKNFLVFRWEDVANFGPVKLKIGAN
jgi:3-phytase